MFEVIGPIFEIETNCCRRGDPRVETPRQILWRRTVAQAERHCAGKAPDYTIMTAEVHWYEAHGIGRKELEIKRLLN